METLIFYLDKPRKKLPQFKQFTARLVEPDTVEIDLVKDLPLTEVFSEFCQAKIQVLRMRNKSNRLEQLFLDLIKGDKS